MKSRPCLTVFLLLVVLLPIAADAAMYAYVDARGICHYTNAPGDGRYKLNERPARRVGSPEDQLIGTILRRSSSRLSLAAPQALNTYIHVAASTHQVDPLLIKAVIQAESNFDPNAVSSKGAQGLMQLMPSTAAQLGVTDAFHAESNIDGGTRYLRDLLVRYNDDIPKALAAYNAGPERVARYGGLPPFRETHAYVARVIRDFNRKKLQDRQKLQAVKAPEAKPVPRKRPATRTHPKAAPAAAATARITPKES